MNAPKIPARLRGRRLAGLTLLAAACLVAAGCSYTRLLRNRLPTPHRVDDFENAVRFVYEAPQAKHVNLCGNWDENGWCGTQASGRFDHTIGAMQDDDKDGIWEVVIPLRPGRYLYKFAVDWGIRWESDQNNPLGEDDGYGGANSILILH
ncbi:glycogen-binding domain-containing protein [bacterium]|nr:glycogen-binding domain-containing protein [bacterium]